MDSNRATAIGLVGGLGPGATIHYYGELVHGLEAAGTTPDLLVVHADRSRVLQLVRDRNERELAAYLAGYIGRLKAAGAAVVAIPAVAPHMAVGRLHDISPLPIVDMIEVVRGALNSRRLKNVTLFGTRDVIETGLFGRLDGLLTLTMPAPHEIDEIDRIYRRIVAEGVSTADGNKALRRIALDIIKRDATQAIVLAGTELALAVDSKQTDFPVVDCSRLHIDEIIREATRHPPAASVRDIMAAGGTCPVGPYSQAVVAGPYVFFSGQLPIDPSIGEAPSGIAEQTRLTLANLFALLQSARLTPASVVKVQVFMTDLEGFDEMNRVYAQFFPAPAPARTTVGVRRLPQNVLIKIDAMALAE